MRHQGHVRSPSLVIRRQHVVFLLSAGESHELFNNAKSGEVPLPPGAGPLPRAARGPGRARPRRPRRTPEPGPVCAQARAQAPASPGSDQYIVLDRRGAATVNDAGRGCDAQVHPLPWRATRVKGSPPCSASLTQGQAHWALDLRWRLAALAGFEGGSRSFAARPSATASSASSGISATLAAYSRMKSCRCSCASARSARA